MKFRLLSGESLTFLRTYSYYVLKNVKFNYVRGKIMARTKEEYNAYMREYMKKKEVKERAAKTAKIYRQTDNGKEANTENQTKVRSNVKTIFCLWNQKRKEKNI